MNISETIKALPDLGEMHCDVKLVDDETVYIPVPDLKRLIDVLEKCREKWDTAGNGRCDVCHIGFRLFDLKGNVQQCDWAECLSHEIREALGK